MKKLFLLIFSAFCLALSMNAKTVGDNEWEYEYRYKVTANVLNVREAPENGRVLFTLSEGDYVYGEHLGNGWFEINSYEPWYVASDYLVIERNPYYNNPDLAGDDDFDMARTLKTQMVARWILLALCIIAFILYLSAGEGFDRIVDYFDFGCCNILDKKYTDSEGKEQRYIMKQTFCFGPTPYVAVLDLTGGIVGSIIAALLAMTVIGCVVWLFFAIGWALSYALIAVGWILLIGGILLGIFGVFGGGCLVLIAGIIIGCIGGSIVEWNDDIVDFANAAIESGFRMFRDLSVWSFARDLLYLYWKPALIIAALPFALFLSIVLIIYLISGIFVLIENIQMKRYNIENPCPVCHHPSEPAVYMSKGLELPVKLHPGRYGLLHLTHPITKEKMPTMIFNGKDKLTRKCNHCGAVISAKMATEKHVALVGVAEAGKTSLVYRTIAHILSSYKGRSEFTDEMDSNMVSCVDTIKADGYMKDFPDKTPVGVMRSIQLFLKDKDKDSYRLFLNDVGGELYNVVGLDKESSRKISLFTRNMNVVLFLIDPMTTDFSECEMSPRFREWVKNNQDEYISRCNLGETFRRFNDLLRSQKLSDSYMKKMHLMVLFVKKDMGYIESVGDGAGKDLRKFMVADMGLAGLSRDMENVFGKNISYMAVSASEEYLKESGIPEFTKALMDKLDIEM